MNERAAMILNNLLVMPSCEMIYPGGIESINLLWYRADSLISDAVAAAAAEHRLTEDDVVERLEHAITSGWLTHKPADAPQSLRGNGAGNRFVWNGRWRTEEYHYADTGPIKSTDHARFQAAITACGENKVFAPTYWQLVTRAAARWALQAPTAPCATTSASQPPLAPRVR